MDDQEKQQEEIKNQRKQLRINIPYSQILYSDVCYVTSGKMGIVLDFVQNDALRGQQNVVSRVGMSKEHAEALIKTLSTKLIDLRLQEKKSNERQFDN